MTVAPRTSHPAVTLPADALDTALWNAACEESGIGLLAVAPDGALIRANRWLATIFGLAADPDAADPLDALAAGFADKPGFARLRHAAIQDPLLRFDAELVLVTGAELEMRSVPVRDPAQRPIARLWLFRDIGAQRRTERRLIEQEARFRSVVEQELAGVCIIDAAETLVYVNLIFARFFGKSPEAVVGQPLAGFVPPEQLPAARDALQALLSGRQRTARLTYALQDRNALRADVRVHATAACYAGQPAVVAVVLDITELEQVRRELEFANIIIEQSPVVLFQAEARPGFRRSYISRNVTQFGYSVEQVYAGAFAFPDCVLPVDRPAIMADVGAMLDGRSDLFEQDYRVTTADGSIRWIHDRTVPIRDAAGNTVALRGTMIDVTERKLAEQSLARANRTLRTLSSGNEVLVRATSEQQLLEDMCRVLVETGGYPMCWIGFVGEQSDGAPHVAAIRQRVPDDATGAACWSLTAMVQPDSAAVAALARGAVTIQRRPPDCRLHTGCGQQHDCRCVASAAFPFLRDSAAPGALVLAADAGEAFDPDEVRLLSELASDLGYGLQALRAHAAHDATARRLRDSMTATVQALVSTLEQRDPYTAGHQRRVALLSAAIARRLGLPEEEIEGIVLAAVVHDVGKISVPADILSRPGRLSRLEYQLVQTHAEAGYDILKGIDFPWPVARMVREHHERLDGSGYPLGLSGSDILIGSRILAVADVVESMMTHRPYRAAVGRAAALAEIVKGSGRLYDPSVVDACIALFEQEGFAFPTADHL